MAILKLENNPRWKEIGGHLLVPVHDELIVEVPIQHREEGEEILRKSMEDAGSFLPLELNAMLKLLLDGTVCLLMTFFHLISLQILIGIACLILMYVGYKADCLSVVMSYQYSRSLMEVSQ